MTTAPVPPPPPPGAGKPQRLRLYEWFRAILRAAVGVFFRQVEVVGLEHVPEQGAVIFAGNHPNSLIDPVLIVTSCGRVVRFAAKDVLFRSRLLRPLMNAIGAVPIARRVDHVDDATSPADASTRNQAAFDTLIGVLSSGGAIGIFPEGLSHDGPHLARLKTGAARIALGACARDAGAPVSIVPCGLTYMQRKRFRSRVLLQFGTALVIDAASAARPDAVTAITAELDRALRALTVNASDWETLRVLDGIRRLYQPPEISIEQRVELARRFSSEYPRVRADPEVRAVYARVEAYLDRLRDGGLTDRDLQRDLRPREAIERVVRHLLLLLVWLPLALPGAILHAPAGILVKLAAPLLTPRKDVLGATKFMAGLLTVLASYVAGIAWVGWRFGALPALVALVALPITGYATVQVFDRGASLRRGLTTLLRLVTLRRELAALRAERAALEDGVVRAVNRLRPAEMVPLFPREPRTGPA